MTNHTRYDPDSDPPGWELTPRDVLTFIGLGLLVLLFWALMLALGSWTGGHL